MDTLERLADLDNQLKESIQYWFNEWYNIQIHRAGLLNQIEPLSHPSVFLAGSCMETGSICRSVASQVIDLEYDIMFEVGVLPSEQMGRKYLHKIEGMTGYYHLKTTPTGEYLHPSYIEATKQYGKSVLIDDWVSDYNEIVNIAWHVHVHIPAGYNIT